MMPAKVRAEGIALYKNAQVEEVAFDTLKLTAVVDGEPVVYDLDGQSDSCFCATFQANHRYCAHLAAVEEYLKKEKAQQEKVVAVVERAETKRAQNAEFEVGRTFLARMNEDLEADDKQFYTLDVEVFNASSSEDFQALADFLAVTLRIRKEKMPRSYVVRDIPAFLKAVAGGDSYSTGQLYFSPMSLANFDDASAHLLEKLISWQQESFLMATQNFYQKSGRYLVLPYIFVEEFLDLIASLEDFSVTIDMKKLNYWAFVPLSAEANLFSLSVKPQDDEILLDVRENHEFMLYDGRLVIAGQTFYVVSEKQHALITRLRQVLPHVSSEKGLSSRLSLSYDDKDALAQAMQLFTDLGEVNVPPAFQIRSFRPAFSLSLTENQLVLKMSFDYGDFEISSFQELETLEFSRDLRLEKKIFETTAQMGFPEGFESARARLLPDEFYSFYEHFLPQLETLGVLSLDEALEAQDITAEPEISVSLEGSLLDISFSLPNVADSEFSRILSALTKGARHIVTADGNYLKLDQRFEPLKSALETSDDLKISGNHLMTESYRAFALSSLFENVPKTSFNKRFETLFYDLTHPEEFPVTLPETLDATLRDYQLTGVRWMKMLAHYNMSGILADDMGLGKTLQAITYLLSALTTSETSDCALIVAPSSLVYNWLAEFSKFAPGALDVVTVDGSKDERDEKLAEAHQVYITSYGSFLKEAADYEAKNLTYLFLDEAQVVKNFNSKTNKALSALTAAHVFALSGTPIENKIDELWAIFNLLMPGLLPARKAFNKMLPSEVFRTIRPFVLRRKKEDVLTELPDKLEMTHLSELTESQKLVYLAQLEQMKQKFSHLSASDFSRNRLEILAGITRLRQICDTPALFLDDYNDTSGKLETLDALLAQIKDSGRRPLIFSQFTSMFPHIEKLLDKHGLSFYKLTGSTPSSERVERVRAFNAGSRDVFLISLKAGGTGLNLTSSDMVILVDLWWNPAVEEQAISRAHRMGQKKRVEVVRLITKGTIEEKIIEIQKRKKDLFTAILDTNTTTTSTLTQADINEILGITA
jgi:SNF2 family DNA or RNA helicase